MMKLIYALSSFLLLSFNNTYLPGQVVSNPDTILYQSHELTGNKLFVYTSGPTFSFAPYGENIIRIGLHNGQDTAYPASLSVIKEPQGTASLDESTGFLEYLSPGYDITIMKYPFSFSVEYNGKQILDQGGGFLSGDGSVFFLDTGEELAWFGGGSRAIPMNRAGRVLVMRNRPQYGYGWENDQLNINIPMVTSSDAFTLYFENPGPGWLSLGAEEPGLITYAAQIGVQSCFIICDGSFTDLPYHVSDLTGFQPMPPLWSLGYIQSRFGYENQEEAYAVVDGMQAQGFPMDALVFDLQWQGGPSLMGNLQWDNGRFPDPEGMISEFLSRGVKSVVITDPYFTQECGNFGILYGNHWFAQTQAGANYLLDDFWAGRAGLLDITNPSVNSWFWSKYEYILETGAAGLWTDLGEPELNPQDMYYHEGTSDEIHQTYNLRWSKFIFDHFREQYPNQRLFNLTRSGYAGMQRFSTFPWSGDVAKDWGGMYAQIPIMLGMGLSGHGFMQSDIGGFVGGMNGELYTRWQQMGAFTPVMRAHGTNIPPEPIYYPEPYKSIVRDFIKLRYRMLPYNYTLARVYTQTGLPMARPLFYIDPSLTEINDQYLWGDELMIAPVMGDEAVSRQVIFPQGTWIDFFNWIEYSGGQAYQVDASLEDLPVFVRAGAMVPMLPDIMNTTGYTSAEYHINYYPHPGFPDEEARIYMDDGHSRAAELNDEYVEIILHATYDNSLTTIGMQRSGNGFENEPLSRKMVFDIARVIEKPSLVRYNGMSINIAMDKTEYEEHENIALFSPEQYRFLVKVQWESTATAQIEIEDMILGDSFGIEGPHKSAASLDIHPNPFSEQIKVYFSINEPGIYNLSAHDATGRIIAQYSSYFSAGTHKINGNLVFRPALGPGLYFIRMAGPSGSISRKVIKK